MTVLTVAGKADSRAIVYPALYMLKHFGRVSVATDDGAYRRLYHGYEDVGEVSGVSVFVHPRLDAEALADEVTRFAPDYLVCVTNGYVPDYTTHLLVLTGYDRTFDAGNAHTADELAAGADVRLVASDMVTPPAKLPVDNIRELVISRTPIKSKTALSVCLRDGLLQHAAACEEAKALLKHDSRDFIGVLAQLFCPFLIPDAAEVPKIFGFKK
ncbi:hypothetical protein FACS1894208_01020 [Clostridia bacterium]|nr:hypothetical protein FACS1894208_01020 [Clostridia bacterium]